MLCQVALCRDCLGDTISSFIGYNKVATETRSKFVTQNSPIMQFDTTPAQSLVKVQPQTANLTGRLLHVPWPKFMLECANLMCSFHGVFTDQQTVYDAK